MKGVIAIDAIHCLCSYGRLPYVLATTALFDKALSPNSWQIASQNLKLRVALNQYETLFLSTLMKPLSFLISS